jgi:N-acetylglutamate synthase-like GNAT family acetyltransferase
MSKGKPLKISANPPLSAVTELLARVDLPSSDLDQGSLSTFFGTVCDDELVGLVGLELYRSVALLRSLVIDVSARNHGLGRVLVNHAEEFARSKEVQCVYLLTNTAESFFARLGYISVSRDFAPDEIRATTQYSDLCPTDSALMKKRL